VPVVFEDNWWGDASGPSGTGDPVSTDVDFDPWLTTRPSCGIGIFADGFESGDWSAWSTAVF
jgi:hypothetical protein